MSFWKIFILNLKIITLPPIAVLGLKRMPVLPVWVHSCRVIMKRQRESACCEKMA